MREGLAAGASIVTELAAGVVRLRAANPSPMTGSGTNSYVLAGPAGVVVIDPGPALPAHLAALMTAIAQRPVAAILLTHPHLDHSELCPALAQASGAAVLAFGDASAGRTPIMQQLAARGMQGGGEGVDGAFTPDRRVTDGEVLDLAGLQIEVIHTPGHMGSHVSFGFDGHLFSGDHVMGWSTTLVSPPDGDMGAYMASLARLSQRRWQRFFPGHGESVDDPGQRLDELTAHRRAREAAILAAMHSGPISAAQIAARLYTETPAALQGAATRNVLAHLIDLQDRNLTFCSDRIGVDAPFQLRR